MIEDMKLTEHEKKSRRLLNTWSIEEALAQFMKRTLPTSSRGNSPLHQETLAHIIKRP